MSTQTLNVTWGATTQVQHFNWVQAISAALTALGLALTTDTGQLSLAGGSSTITYPGSFVASTATMSGYEIRKMVSSGLPTIYMKIFYGVWSSGTIATNAWPYMTIQFGAGTDGAGNLNGVVNTLVMNFVKPTSAGIPNTSTNRPVYIASDGANYLSFLVDPTNLGTSPQQTASPFSFGLERTINLANGTYNSDGFVWWDLGNGQLTGTSGQAVQAYLNFARGLTGAVNFIPGQTPGKMFAASNLGGPSQLFPITVCVPQAEGPAIAGLIYYTADIGNGVTFQAPMYSISHTYMAMGSFCNAQVDASGTSYRFAMRWE